MKRIMISTAVVTCTALTGAAPASASTAWRVESVPKPASVSAVLTDVSCPLRRDCVAAGLSVNRAGAQSTLAERWDGSSWAIQPTPNPVKATGEFFGVSCASPDSCTAIGWASPDATGGDEPLAERWNGTSWALQSVPNPAGAAEAALNGVSCASPDSCMAVGWYASTTRSADLPLAERWNGASWIAVAVPPPPDASSGFLGDVSCPAALECVAVGSYGVINQETGLFAERWNGSRWTVHVLPHPAGGSFLLSAVSCPAVRSCTAVGGSYDGSQQQASIVERWNKTGWSLQADAAAAHTLLNGVDCPAVRSCTAVGEVWAGQPGTYSTVAAESWDGTSWAIQTVPVPRRTIGAELSGISCLGPAYCTAVGDDNPGGPLAAHEG